MDDGNNSDDAMVIIWLKGELNGRATTCAKIVVFPPLSRRFERFFIYYRRREESGIIEQNYSMLELTLVEIFREKKMKVWGTGKCSSQM